MLIFSKITRAILALQLGLMFLGQIASKTKCLLFSAMNQISAESCHGSLQIYAGTTLVKTLVQTASHNPGKTVTQIHWNQVSYR